MERFRAILPVEDEPAAGLWAKITPTRAYHDDKTNYSDSFGFLIELNNNEQKSNMTDVQVIFGYTGDTKWVYPDMPDPLGKGRNKDPQKERKIEDITRQYKNCDVLLVHLGSLVGKNNAGSFSFDLCAQCRKNGFEYRCEKVVQDNDHTYLVGLLPLLSSYYDNTP